VWGQKNIIFENFIDLPGMSSERFDLIINSSDSIETKKAMNRIIRHGWNVLDPYKLIRDISSYRNFIFSSFAEFSITKETYIKSNSGWFSCRSACYLAAGKPVITQDTKWAKFIPSGKGVFACDDLESTCAATSEITSDYALHAKAAIEVAYEYFDSNKILNKLLGHI
jgi:hypothetical protein